MAEKQIQTTTKFGGQICTNLNKFEFHHKWSFNNFRFLTDEVESPILPANEEKCQWRLSVHPNFNSQVRLTLEVISYKAPMEKIGLVSFVLDANEQKTNMKEIMPHVLQGKTILTSFVAKRETLFDTTKNLLPGDKLTLHCVVNVIGETATHIESNFATAELLEDELAKDFGNLFNNSDFSDVTLEAGGGKVRAHKAILAARSTVFAAMFANETKKNLTNIVTITEVDFEVLEELVRFMYSGKAPNMEKIVHCLLVAADKYAINNLKLMCENSLVDQLTVELAAESLIFADRYSATHLKKITLEFIIANIEEVMQTDGWESLKGTHPHLSVETLQAFVSSKK